MRFEACRPPNWELFGPWGETMERWISEGLDASDPWADMRHRTGMEPGYDTVPVNLGLFPAFEPALLEDAPTYTVARGSDGIVRKQFKGTGNMPAFESHPVATRADWEAVRARLSGDTPGRLPQAWEAMVSQWSARSGVLGLGCFPYGIFGTARDLMGAQGLLMAFYDDPALVHDIMGQLCDLWFAVWEQVLKCVLVDFVQLWEDMSYKNGSLISPAMVREFMMPHYRRLFGLARDFGVDVAWVDTDGDCRALITPMSEAGLTGMYPFEVQAGMDIVGVRRLHPRLQIVGGIDKLAVARGPEAIDRELAAKLPPLLAAGGYIPSLDHLAPPEMSLADFVYYRQRVTEYLGQQPQ